MTDLAQYAVSAGGYILTALIGSFVFLLKREITRYDEQAKAYELKLDTYRRDVDASTASYRRDIDALVSAYRRETDGLLTALENAQRAKWERHTEKHDQLAESVQKIRTELLQHCADSNERFVMKEDFASSTAYLTKKSDEVIRLLQSLER